MKPNNLNIAVTGGIGSGKSEVCRILKKRGFSVFSADDLGHQALIDPVIKQKLILEFGDQIVINKEIDRQTLGNLVFGNKQLSEKLNSIMHPAIISKLKNDLIIKNDPLIFYEIPLLFEAKLENLFDIILMVWSSVDVRKERLIKRTGMNYDKINMIMQSQYSQVKAKERADFVIENNGKIEDLEEAVITLIDSFRSMLEV